MNIMSPNGWIRTALVLANAEFICVESESGFGTVRVGSLESCFYLDPDADDVALGHALLAGLAESHAMPTPQLLESLMSFDRSYKAWVDRMMERFGYRNRRAMFKSMRACWIFSWPDCFEVRPMRKFKRESWNRRIEEGVDGIRLEKTASPAALGAALRLAFERCR